MVQYKKINSEVICTVDDITSITLEDIDIVRDMALSNARGRARICTHQSNDDLLHEMIIVLTKSNYVQPHKHTNKSESFHLIEGSLTVIIFDDDGLPVERINLDKEGKKNSFYYRLSVPRFHTVIPNSDPVIFHEITNGPFSREDTVFADWAPAEDSDKKEQQKYIQTLLDSL